MTGQAPIVRAVAYPPAWRAAAALLRTISGASLAILLLLLLTVIDPPLAPPLLLRLFLIWAVVPAAAAWLIRRALTIDVRVTPTALELVRRDMRVEVPLDSIRRLDPWRVPLPQPGVSLQLQSGRRLRWGLALDDPSRLLEAITSHRGDTTDAALAFARAKAAYGTRSTPYLLAKFAGFALIPATVLFYTHQSIAHGGPLGEYYTFGLTAYLTTYLVYWSTVTIYLVLYASIWRGIAEVACLLAAWMAPENAVAVRRWSERASAILYYGGIPLILGLRYFS